MRYLDPPEVYEPIDHMNTIIELFGYTDDDPLSNENTGELKCNICPRRHRCRDSTITQSRDSEIEAQYWFRQEKLQRLEEWRSFIDEIRGFDIYSGEYINSPEYNEYMKEETAKVMEYIDSGRADFEYDAYKERRMMGRL